MNLANISLNSMLHGIMMNGCLGSITGLANIIPKALVNVYDLYKAGKIEEAKAAQRKISLAGELELKAGVPGMRVSTSSRHLWPRC